jgi:hypothetical protein
MAEDIGCHLCGGEGVLSNKLHFPKAFLHSGPRSGPSPGSRQEGPWCTMLPGTQDSYTLGLNMDSQEPNAAQHSS